LDLKFNVMGRQYPKVRGLSVWLLGS